MFALDAQHQLFVFPDHVQHCLHCFISLVCDVTDDRDELDDILALVDIAPGFYSLELLLHLRRKV